MAKGLTRTSTGFTARVYRNRQTYSQNFAFRDYSDEASAQAAAQAFIDNLEAQFPKVPKKGPSITEQSWMGSHYWNVSYTVEKKLKSKKFYFSPDLDGDKEAAFKSAEAFKATLD